MKTHVIPWMSKEETEHLLRELKMEIGMGYTKPAAEQPVIDVPAKAEVESDSSKPAALDIGSL